jgi:hypothetical protein
MPDDRISQLSPEDRLALGLKMMIDLNRSKITELGQAIANVLTAEPMSKIIVLFVLHAELEATYRGGNFTPAERTRTEAAMQELAKSFLNFAESEQSRLIGRGASPTKPN